MSHGFARIFTDQYRDRHVDLLVMNPCESVAKVSA